LKTPKAPDPVTTAAAQTSSNIDTALLSNQINMTNQEGPWGSTMYDQSGASTYTDSFGKTHTIPQFTQTTTYNPEQQAIFDKTTQTQTNLADLATEQSAKFKDYLNDPFEFNNQDAADWSYDLASSRILPQQQEAQKALETRLVNQGLRPGTQAWDSEMRRMTNANTDQMNQLALTGRNQAFNEAAYERSAPINELSALLSGSQIGSPNGGFSAAPQSQVAGTDYAGLVQQNYQNQMQNAGGALGGLFGLAGSLGGAALKYGPALSDRRAKTDIRRVGTLDNGLPIYLFRYKAGGPMQVGLMAQDVLEVNPEAVVPMGDHLGVDYGMAVQ